MFLCYNQLLDSHNCICSIICCFFFRNYLVGGRFQVGVHGLCRSYGQHKAGFAADNKRAWWREPSNWLLQRAQWTRVVGRFDHILHWQTEWVLISFCCVGCYCKINMLILGLGLACMAGTIDYIFINVFCRFMNYQPFYGSMSVHHCRKSQTDVENNLLRIFISLYLYIFLKYI